MPIGSIPRRSVGRLLIALVLSSCASNAGVPGSVESPSGSRSAAPSTSPPPTAAPSASVAPTTNPDVSTAPLAIDPKGTCTADRHLCTSMAVASWTPVPFTPPVRCSDAGRMCQLVAKVFAPTAPGPWPLIVLVGASGPPDNPDSYVDPLGEQLAGRGFVVVRAIFREGLANGASYPGTFADIACAVGFARRTGPTYGAGSGPLTLVGHSFAGWVASVVALTPTGIKPADGSCLETTGSLRPDRFAGLDGAYTLNDGHAEWLGGDRDQVPATWAAVDPFVLAPAVTAAQRIPVDLIVGANDEDWLDASISLSAAMHKVGWTSRLINIPGTDHVGVLSSKVTLDALIALARGS